MKDHRAGFTILEIVIFLSISGLLLTVAFLGTGAMARNARFSDTLNSLQSFVQRQYDEVANGVNTRDGINICGTTVAGTAGENCLMLGKAIHFKQATADIVTTYIISSVAMSSDTTLSLQSQFGVMQPQETNPQQSIITWKAPFTKGSRGVAVPYGSIDTVAFVRSPESSRIFTYLYDSNYGMSNPGIALYNNVTPASGALTSLPQSQGVVCIANETGSSMVGALRFTGGSGAAAIVTDFQPVVGATQEC